jgi:N-dimethylarginine dimethylaminohydrolase
MPKINKVDTFSRLQCVMLGSFYPAPYWDCVPDPATRSAMQKITTEIHEDLDHFQRVLESAGVQVIRPDVMPADEFAAAVEQHRELLPPPLHVRNSHLVLNDRLFKINRCAGDYVDRTLSSHGYHIHDLVQANEQIFQQGMAKHSHCHDTNRDMWYRQKKYSELAGPDWPAFEDYVSGSWRSSTTIHGEISKFEQVLCYETKEIGPLQAPNLIPDSGRLIVDCNEYCSYTEFVRNCLHHDGEVILIDTGAGHSDGCFAVLGNKTIIGIKDLIDYHAVFPGHSVIEIENHSYMDHIVGYNKIRTGMQGRWYVPGEETNVEFIKFVNTYLREWVGYVDETVFDVNVLSLDQDTVFVSGCTDYVIDQLDSQGIRAVHIPWRHRFFVDGGLHCITLDLCRS